MDGNNRWAKKHGLPGIAGHKFGVERIREVMTECQKLGVDTLTVFAFSSENWRRPPKEVEVLMGLFLTYLKREAKKLNEGGVSLRIVGDRARFSDKIRKAIVEAEAVASTGATTLVIAANYGGRWDIANAARTLAAKVAAGELIADDINEDVLNAETCLAGQPPLDLLIRTGGDVRISNFLLWQAAYAELYFTDVLWPDFGPEEMHLAAEDFYSRQRRFGKTGDQIEAEDA
tara:strand:- start:1022 stop:1714 length:693 start_codon:yes stop_codon:yes gene_type:complete